VQLTHFVALLVFQKRQRLQPDRIAIGLSNTPMR
jgi:hypothetical protein